MSARKPPPERVEVLVCEEHGPIFAEPPGHNTNAFCGDCPPDRKARVAWHPYMFAGVLEKATARRGKKHGGRK